MGVGDACLGYMFSGIIQSKVKHLYYEHRYLRQSLLYMSYYIENR